MKFLTKEQILRIGSKVNEEFKDKITTTDDDYFKKLKKRCKSNIAEKIVGCTDALKKIASISGSEKISENTKKKFLSFELFKKYTTEEQQASLIESGWSNDLKQIYTNEWLLSEAKIRRIEEQLKVTLESIYTILENDGAEPEEEEENTENITVTSTVVPVETEKPEWNDHDQNK